MFEFLLFQLVCPVVKRQRRHAKINVLHKLLLVHKRGEFNLFGFTVLFQNILVYSHLLIKIPETSTKFQKHRKHCQKHSATSRNENAVQLRKHSVEIVENIMHMELENDVKLHLKTFAPKNSSQIHLLSRLHQVQMNFTENEVLLQKLMSNIILQK